MGFQRLRFANKGGHGYWPRINVERPQMHDMSPISPATGILRVALNNLVEATPAHVAVGIRAFRAARLTTPLTQGLS